MTLLKTLTRQNELETPTITKPQRLALGWKTTYTRNATAREKEAKQTHLRCGELDALPEQAFYLVGDEATALST